MECGHVSGPEFNLVGTEYLSEIFANDVTLTTDTSLINLIG